MTEEELEKYRADIITRALSTEGGKEILIYISERLKILQDRVANNEGDVGVGKIETKITSQNGKNIEITVVKIENDVSKIEARLWSKFLNKVKEWQELAEVK